MGFFQDVSMLAIVAAALLLMVLIGGFMFWRERAQASAFELQRKSRLFTPAERSFFECLMPALSDDFYIFIKVPFLDVLGPRPSASSAEIAKIAKRLRGEHFDYVLCKKSDLGIFGVIELEHAESKQTAQARVKREQFLNAICKSAHLRLFYFDIRQDYEHVDIQRLITGYSSKPEKKREVDAVSRSQFSIDNSSYAAFAKKRTCPKCNGEVVTKVAVKGKRIGEKFLMCRKYPYCDYRISVNDEMVRGEAAEAEQVTGMAANEASRPGFKDWSAG